MGHLDTEVDVKSPEQLKKVPMTLDINSILSIGFGHFTPRNGHLSGLFDQVRARVLLSDPLGGLTQWGVEPFYMGHEGSRSMSTHTSSVAILQLTVCYVFFACMLSTLFMAFSST